MLELGAFPRLNVLSNKHQVRGLPFRRTRFEIGAHSAHDILDASKAVALQEAGGNGRAIATAANYRERLFPEDLDRDDPWQFKNIRVV